jgi:hypothetical protein
MEKKKLLVEYRDNLDAPGKLYLDTENERFIIFLDKRLSPEERFIVHRHELCHLWRQDILTVKLLNLNPDAYNIAADAIINQWLAEEYPSALKVVDNLNGIVWQKEKENYGDEYPHYRLGTYSLYLFYKNKMEGGNSSLHNNTQGGNNLQNNNSQPQSNSGNNQNQQQNNKGNNNANPNSEFDENKIIPAEEGTLQQIYNALKKAMEEIQNDPEYQDIQKLPGAYKNKINTKRKIKIKQDPDIEKVAALLVPMANIGDKRTMQASFFRKHPTIPYIPRKMPSYKKEGRLILDISGSMSARSLDLLSGVLARYEVSCYVFSDELVPLAEYEKVLHGGTSWNCVKKFITQTSPVRTIIITDEEWLDADREDVRAFCKKHHVFIYNIDDHKFVQQ